MNYRLTLVLLVILAALGLSVYAYEGQGIGKPKPKETQVPFLDVKKDEINRIEVTEGITTTVVVKDTNGLWWLDVPEKAEGDQTRMDEITSKLDSLKADRIVREQAENLADFGLDKPALEVKIGTTDGRTIEIIGGSKTITGDKMYAKLKDKDPIYLVSYDILGRLVGMVTVPPMVTPTPTPAPPTPTPTLTPTPTPSP